jgi:hypothetical protein
MNGVVVAFFAALDEEVEDLEEVVGDELEVPVDEREALSFPVSGNA